MRLSLVPLAWVCLCAPVIPQDSPYLLPPDRVVIRDMATVPLTELALITRLDEAAHQSSAAANTLEGQRCTLSLRRLPQEAPAINITSGRKEVFVYVMRGAADVSSAGSHRANAGTVIVIPPGEHSVRLRAAGSQSVEFAEFSVRQR